MNYIFLIIFLIYSLLAESYCSENSQDIDSYTTFSNQSQIRKIKQSNIDMQEANLNIQNRHNLNDNLDHTVHISESETLEGIPKQPSAILSIPTSISVPNSLPNEKKIILQTGDSSLEKHIYSSQLLSENDQTDHSIKNHKNNLINCPSNNKNNIIDIYEHHQDITIESLALIGKNVKPKIIAHNAQKLTLDQVIKYAVKNNSDIRRAINDVRYASGKYTAARSGYMPQLTINTSYAWSNLTQNNKNSTLQALSNPRHKWLITFAGSQLIYDGGKTFAQISAAKLNEYIAYFNLRKTVDSVITTIIEQFFQVILNKSLVVTNERQVELYKIQLLDQQIRYEAGSVPRFNVLQAQVQLSNSQPGLIQSENTLRNSMFQLVQLIGMNYPNLGNVKIPFDLDGELTYDPVTIDTNDSIHTALVRNPGLKAQRLNILVAAQQLKIAHSGWYPTITANTGYQIQDLRYNGTTTNTALIGWFAGSEFTWSIFDGFLTVGESKAAKAMLMSAKVTYDDTVRAVILQVQTAISLLQQAEETVASQKDNLSQALEALRLARARLAAGDGVQLDVINAQTQFLQAQTSVLSSLFNYISAIAEYNRALSLQTEYQQNIFDDPLTKTEKRKYYNINNSDHVRPKLPRIFETNDPLPPSLTFDKMITPQDFFLKNKKIPRIRDKNNF